MKTDLDHLPEHKRAQIEYIRDYILKYSKNVSLEYIILFGSYSTGKWVENEYRDKHGWVQGHLSDIDILVLTKTKKHADKSLHWSRIEDAIINKRSHALMNFPSLTIIAHSLDFFNEMVRDHYYFYVDILKEGTILYNANNLKLAEPGVLTPSKIREKAVDAFEQWFESANHFYYGYEKQVEVSHNKIAAFELHQATERYYHCFSLVFIDYKYPIHDIKKLETKCALINRDIALAFPRRDKEDKRLFELLRKAYIDSRYKKDYQITKEELTILGERVAKLRDIVKTLCDEYIKNIGGKT